MTDSPVSARTYGQKNFSATVLIGPADCPSGMLRADSIDSVRERQFAEVTSLLITHGYGSGFHVRTGEYVAGVTLMPRADHTASDRECLDAGIVAEGRPQDRGTRHSTLAAFLRAT